MSQELRLIRRITFKLIPFLILLYLIAYVDRSAVGFAKLHMGADIGIGDGQEEGVRYALQWCGP